MPFSRHRRRNLGISSSSIHRRILARFLDLRGYLPRGIPMLKRVAALPEQMVCRTGETIEVDGLAVAAARAEDRISRTLPIWSGCHRLRQDRGIPAECRRTGLVRRAVLRVAAGIGSARTGRRDLDTRDAMMRRFLSSRHGGSMPCLAARVRRAPMAFALALGVSSVGLMVLPVTQLPAQTASPAAQERDARATHIADASQRFGIPESWIRAVMHRESGGDPRAVSPKGAQGLMQIMPGTWADLRVRYRLGPDPFGERDNIRAGTAYLREMHDRYGTVAGMLAAYNAGPGRVDDLLQTGRPLPRETRAYIATILSSIGDDAAADVSPARPSDFRDAPIFVQRGSTSNAEHPRSVDKDSSSNKTRSVIEGPAPFDSDESSTEGSNSLFVSRRMRGFAMRHSFDPERSPASAIVRCSECGREPGEGRTGWQDKSREVRGTGSDADALILHETARSAIFARTLCPLATLSHASLFRTSRGLSRAR